MFAKTLAKSEFFLCVSLLRFVGYQMESKLSGFVKCSSTQRNVFYKGRDKTMFWSPRL